MRIRHMIFAVAVISLLTLWGLLLDSRAQRAEPRPERELVLRNGERVRGQFLTLGSERYLLQTQEECVLLLAQDVQSVDGKTLPVVALDAVVIRELETFEEIDRTGSLLVRTRFRVHAPARGVLTEVDWGLAAHEVAWLADYHVLDGFWRELRYRVEDAANGGKKVFVELDRPLLAGEDLELSIVFRQPGLVKQEGAEWVYRHRGDYPDPRLVTRTLFLPAGATVVSVTPAATHQQTARDGKTTVIWRRYFAAAEVFPFEVRYRL